MHIYINSACVCVTNMDSHGFKRKHDLNKVYTKFIDTCIQKIDLHIYLFLWSIWHG